MKLMVIGKVLSMQLTGSSFSTMIYLGIYR